MPKLNLTIADPCHENWDHMKAETGGRYCAVCEKTVKDFTGQTRAQIETYLLQHSSENICGRFRSTDIRTAARVAPAKMSWFRSRWMAFVAAVSFLGFGKKSAAVPHQEWQDEPDTENKNISPKTGQTVIHGWVRSIDQQKGLSHVEIRVYSGGKEIAYSTNFSNGSYFITIPEHTIWDYKVTLEYNAVNYEAKVLHDIPAMKNRLKIDVLMAGAMGALTPVSVIIPETYVMGGIDADMVMPVEPPVPVEPERITMGAVAYKRVEPDPIYQLVKEEAEKKDSTVVAPQAFNIKTYPNPSTGIFNLALENSEGAQLMIYDLSGKLVLNKKVFSSLETVDLTNQPNGTYLVMVVDETTGLKKQNKVVKMQ